MIAERSNVENLERQLLDSTSPAIVLDGGTGTQVRDILLERHGIPLREGIWSATPQVTGHEEVLYEIAYKFAKAGAQILTPDNYRTQKHIFIENGYTEKQAQEANRVAIEATLAARDDVDKPDIVVAFSQASMDDCYKPILRFSFEDLVIMHYAHAEASVDAGGELMIAETLPTIDEARAALLAAQKLGVKAIVSYYCRDTKPGEQGIWLPNPSKAESLEEAVYVAKNLGAVAVATNCIKPTKGREHVEFLMSLEHLDLPVGTWVQGYEHGCREVDPGIVAKKYPDHVLNQTRQCLRAGARIVGGCCNIDEYDISKMVTAAKEEAELRAVA